MAIIPPRDDRADALRWTLENLKPGGIIDVPGSMKIVKDPALDSDKFYMMDTRAQQAEYRPRQDYEYGTSALREYEKLMNAQIAAAFGRGKQLPPGHYTVPPPIPLRTSPFITLENQRMNLSAAVMLFEENGVRPVRVEYDPDKPGNNNPNVVFKTVDETLKVGDIVVVESHTRHKFTTAKVTAVGFADVPVDFENPQRWGWIVQKCDTDAYDSLLAGEKNLVGKVAEANANKMRADLKNAMGLDKVDLASVFGKRGADALPAPAAPPAVEPDAPAKAPRERYTPPPRTEDDIPF